MITLSVISKLYTLYCYKENKRRNYRRISVDQERNRYKVHIRIELLTYGDKTQVKIAVFTEQDEKQN